MFLILALSLGMVLRATASPAPRITIRLAGDEWFLDSLTKTGMITEFQQKTGIHVEVLHKNDHAILSDLDHGPSSDEDTLDVIVVRHRLLGALVQKRQVREIDSFLADPATHDAGFAPQEQLFTKWWRELQFLCRPHLWFSLHRPDDLPVLSQRSAERPCQPTRL